MTTHDAPYHYRMLHLSGRSAIGEGHDERVSEYSVISLRHHRRLSELLSVVAGLTPDELLEAVGEWLESRPEHPINAVRRAEDAVESAGMAAGLSRDREVDELEVAE